MDGGGRESRTTRVARNAWCGLGSKQCPQGPHSSPADDRRRGARGKLRPETDEAIQKPQKLATKAAIKCDAHHHQANSRFFGQNLLTGEKKALGQASAGGVGEQ